jgi:hypothetical protein
MNIGHFVFLALVLLVGVVFAGWLRQLPLISMLPRY